MLPVCPSVRLAKHLKHMRQEVGFNAFSRVFETDDAGVVTLFERYSDNTTGWSEFDCIVEQIPGNLLQSQWVAQHEQLLILEVQKDRYVFRVGFGLDRVDRIL